MLVWLSWLFLRPKCRVRLPCAGGICSHTRQHSRHTPKEISLGSGSEGFPTHRRVEHHRCAFGFGLSPLSAVPLKLKLEQHKNSVVTECGETYLHVTLSLLSFSCTPPQLLSSKIVSVAHKTAKIVGSQELPILCNRNEGKNIA